MSRRPGITGGTTVLVVMSLLMAQRDSEAETRVEMYPAKTGVVLADTVSGMVQDQEIKFLRERIWHSDGSGDCFMEVAFARFAANGPVRVKLVTEKEGSGTPVVRGLGREIPVEVVGGGVRFELPGAGRYVLLGTSMAPVRHRFTVALWVDDLAALNDNRKQINNKAVIDVTRRGVASDARLDQTKLIQGLLDQGGTLCFPAGIYRTGSLRVSSNTTVYLAPGAVIRALDREDAVGAEFIAIENARSVKLCGQGTFDANSLGIRRGHNVHHVNITSSQDVTLEDLLFKESNSWAIHIRKSDRFTARNVKVFSGKDGFDPDASRDVLIDGAFIMSADDAVAVKNRFPEAADGKTTERVTIRNTIACSMKSALKIGTETRGPIREVTFENCDVFDGERGVVLYARDGGPIERAVWRNLRLFMIDWPKEKESGAVFHLNIERREAPTPVRDCLIENVTANWIYRSAFGGLPEAPLEGVTLRNITVKVGRPKAGRPYLFEAGPNVRLPIEGLTVDWQGNETAWAGVASGKGVVVSGARSETGKRTNQ